jgi:iron complex transport system ATP-binding protein
MSRADDEDAGRSRHRGTAHTSTADDEDAGRSRHRGAARRSLEFHQLAIGYRSRRRTTPVAAGLSAVARPGELTVLLGPNGCGKSTLIRTLCGLLPALSGQVLLDGTPLADVAVTQLARRVAVVLTDRVEPGLLSARELTALGRIPYLGLTGRLTPDDHRIVEEALGAVGARHLAARPAAVLSDGERQRVLTARALAQQPEVLVLDEPTAFLDVPSRTGLVEMLRGLARDQHLTIVMSTHDLELALRVADRVWLLGRDGRLADGTPEELMLAGQIGAEFDSDTLRFDPLTGAFAVQGRQGRSARVEGPDGLRSAVQRVLAREDWTIGEPAELVITAADSDRITVHAIGFGGSATLGALPELIRGIDPDTARCAPAADAAAALAELADINAYFAIGTGPVDNGWRPVQQLYSDPGLLGDIVERVQVRLGAAEPRVAASMFFLGFAARLWSIGIGAVAGHRLLPALSPDVLLFREFGGQIALHITRPVAWQGDDLQPKLADTVLDAHLASLSAALQQLTNVSPEMLRGNAASALLGAAREYDRHLAAASPGPGWQLARGLCADERLVDTVCFSDDDYRRRSCCLYYRTPRGGLCGDCVFTQIPGNVGRKDAS